MYTFRRIFNTQIIAYRNKLQLDDVYTTQFLNSLFNQLFYNTFNEKYINSPCCLIKYFNTYVYTLNYCPHMSNNIGLEYSRHRIMYF